MILKPPRHIFPLNGEPDRPLRGAIKPAQSAIEQGIIAAISVDLARDYSYSGLIDWVTGKQWDSIGAATGSPYKTVRGRRYVEIHPSPGSTRMDAVWSEAGIIGANDDVTLITHVVPKNTSGNNGWLWRYVGGSGDGLRLQFTSSTQLRAAFIDASAPSQTDSDITIPNVPTDESVEFAAALVKRGMTVQAFVYYLGVLYEGPVSSNNNTDIRGAPDGVLQLGGEAGHHYFSQALVFNKALPSNEVKKYLVDRYRAFEPANDTPYLVSLPDAATQTLYVVVQPSATAAPSVAQVKAGQDGTGSAATYASSQTASTSDDYTFNADNLTAGTAYKSYFVWSDGTDDTAVFPAAGDEFTTQSAAADRTGSIAVTLDVLTPDLNGTHVAPASRTGSIDVALDALTVDLNGTAAAPGEAVGSIAVTLDALTPDLNGAFVSAGGVAGSVAVTLDALAPDLNGTHVAPASRTGSIGVTLDALTPDLNGLVAGIGERIGVVDVALDELVPALTGAHVAPEGRTGSISVNLSALAPELVGSFAAPAGRTGAITFVLDAIAPTVIGDVTPPPRVGDIAVTLDPAVAAIYGYEASGVRLATPTMRRNADQELRRAREQALIRPGDGT